MKLTIELVPKTSWYSNVRSNVSRKEWDVIRKRSYSDANHVCEICGGVGTKHPVECHEIWDYNDETHEQTLVGLISLCPKCHGVKHAGLSISKGKEDLVVSQLMKVNGMTRNQAITYINESFDKFVERSKYTWKVNIEYLQDYMRWHRNQDS